MEFGPLRSLQQRIAHHFYLPDPLSLNASENTQTRSRSSFLPLSRMALAMGAAFAIALFLLVIYNPPSDDKAPPSPNETPQDRAQETYEFIFQTEEQALSAIQGGEDPSSSSTGHRQDQAEVR